MTYQECHEATRPCPTLKKRARQQQSGGTDVDDDIPEVKKNMTRSQMTRRPTFDERMVARQVPHEPGFTLTFI